LCVGWLEPLIDPIAKNPNVSSVPVIETIDYIDFSVSNSSIDQILVGGFNWNLVFD
jgi:polypeptide N-acetylgalactosaminyltransferase